MTVEVGTTDSHGRDRLAVTRRPCTPTTYFLGRPADRWREALNGHRRPIRPA